MNYWKEHSTVIGGIVFAFVVISLIANPSVLFARGVQFIDSDLGDSDGRTFVRTRMDLGSKETALSFPMQIGRWQATDKTKPWLEEALDADVLFQRNYSLPDFPLPVYFLIIRSKSTSSFHPPPVCYQAQGWEIEEEGKETIPITDTSWAETYTSPPEQRGLARSSGGKQPYEMLGAKKMVVVRKSDGKVIDRRVVLYFYVKKNSWVGSDNGAITMIRVSTNAPEKGSYEGVLNVIRNFTGDVIPYIFEPKEPERIYFVQLTDGGVKGWLLLTVLFAVPLGMIAWPRVRRRRGDPM